MLSAKTDEDSKAQSKICGADVFISKPFSMKYLVASVNQLIEMRRTLIFRFPKETAAGIHLRLLLQILLQDHQLDYLQDH